MKEDRETAHEKQCDKLRKTVQSEQELSNSTSGLVDHDIHISPLNVFHEMDRRKSRNITEVLDWYRDEDAGVLRGNKLNEFVDHVTAFDALDEKSMTFWKSREIDESNQKIVMDEKFVNHCDGCQNRSEGCDGSVNIFYWWMERITPSNQKMEEFMDENEPWLLIGSAKEIHFFEAQYLERETFLEFRPTRGRC